MMRDIPPLPTKIAVALLASFWLCGCSTTSTLALRNGTRLEAKIQRDTPEAILVQTKGGAEAWIPRSDIAMISHPGTLPMIFGVSLISVGMLSFTISDCEQSCSAQRAVGTGSLFAAVPLLIWGLVQLGSRPSSAPSNSQASPHEFVPTTHGDWAREQP